MNIHADNNPFFCEPCKEGFTRRSTLEQHNDRYHRKLLESFDCNECDSKFTSKSNLKRHVVIKHSSNSEEFGCKLCDKKFNRKDNLLKHKTLEHNIRKDILVIPTVNDEKCLNVAIVQKFTIKNSHCTDILKASM